jgi:hypothetical protein
MLELLGTLSLQQRQVLEGTRTGSGQVRFVCWRRVCRAGQQI